MSSKYLIAYTFFSEETINKVKAANSYVYLTDEVKSAVLGRGIYKLSSYGLEFIF